MKEKLLSVVSSILGRNLSYRFGRSLYMRARGDLPNQMNTNGERYMQLILAKAMENGGGGRKTTIMDVGANIGEWSRSMIDALRRSRIQDYEIHLFEPVSGTMEMLRDNLGEDERLFYNEAALSSETGEDVIYIKKDGAGTNSLHEEMLESVSSREKIVKLTVDAYAREKGIERIDFLKCDTEGHDAEVIYGAKQLLSKGRIAVLQFEYNYRWIASRHYLKDVFDFVNGMDYALGKICRDHVELYDEWHYELEKYFETNYVLIQAEFVPWFNVIHCSMDVSNSIDIQRVYGK